VACFLTLAATPTDAQVSGTALHRDSDIASITGMIITNNDPGGIANDDILYQLAALTG